MTAFEGPGGAHTAHLAATREQLLDAIASWLHQRGLRYLQDQDDNFVVAFAYSDGLGRRLETQISVDEDAEILAIHTWSDRLVGEDAVSRALLVCNGWNATHRWPTAYFVRHETPAGTPRHQLFTAINVFLVGDQRHAIPGLCEIAYATSIDFWQTANARDL